MPRKKASPKKKKGKTAGAKKASRKSPRSGAKRSTPRAPSRKAPGPTRASSAGKAPAKGPASARGKTPSARGKTPSESSRRFALRKDDSVGPWTCPRCGALPLRANPLYGEDERHHCPNVDCDEVVTLLSKEDLEPAERRGSWPPQRNKNKAIPPPEPTA